MDEDGFEDQVFIQDDTQSDGFNEAILIDPLSPVVSDKSIS